LEHDAGSRQPSEYALRECFTKMLAVPDQGPIYIVFDAVDECPNSTGTPSSRQDVLSLVKWLSELSSSRLSVCVTSRPEAGIEVILQPLAYHTVSLHLESGQTSDIANYIKWFVNSDPSAQKWRKEDREYVVEKLSERAEGMWDPVILYTLNTTKLMKQVSLDLLSVGQVATMSTLSHPEGSGRITCDIG
jgi:hypothetical protein